MGELYEWIGGLVALIAYVAGMARWVRVVEVRQSVAETRVSALETQFGELSDTIDTRLTQILGNCRIHTEASAEVGKLIAVMQSQMQAAHQDGVTQWQKIDALAGKLDAVTTANAVVANEVHSVASQVASFHKVINRREEQRI